MDRFVLNTPVLFIIFNRPQTTKRVFHEIAKVKPKQLFIAADGPRDGRHEDQELCKQTREIVEKIDWPCEIHKDYSEKNLGCRFRPMSAIDWVFSKVEKAIILEDDCLPSQSFFRYCQELLDKYQLDTRIMSIAGTNFIPDHKRRNNDSYFFSYFPIIWGWATWKRCWDLFDPDIRHWEEIREGNWLKDLFGHSSTAKIWTNIINASNPIKKDLNAWSYHWKYTCLSQSGLCIIPEHNLISNVGFGENATHSFDSTSPVSDLSMKELEFPLRHPRFVIRDAEVEIAMQNLWVTKLKKRISNKIKKVVARLLVTP